MTTYRGLDIPDLGSAFVGGPTFLPQTRMRRLSQGPNIPNVSILNPMNDTTVRLFIYVQVVEKGDWRGCFTADRLVTLRSNIRAEKKKKKCERNRIGRSNYLVVKWPKCSVFPVLTEGKELRAYYYNKLN